MSSFIKNYLVLAAVAVGISCLVSHPAATAADNKNAAPDSGTMQRADADMRKVLEALHKLGPKPLETLTPEEARKQPTPADAVAAVLRDRGKDPEALRQAMGIDTKDMTYGNGLTARIYTPHDRKTNEKLPVIVYYHGGGWVIADINVYDSTPRAMAQKTGAIVASVEYRHAPEHKFPAAHDDAFAAYKWVIENAASWGGDPSKIAVLGESAGGNLAANVAIMARDKGVQPPVAMILVYPVAGSDMTTPSYQKNAHATPLNKPVMEWFVKHVLSDKDKKDPRIDLVHADVKRLPAATVITADIDPLMSEGKMLADRLKAADVNTAYRNFDGVTHEFFGMDAVVADAAEAQKFAADRLKMAFSMAKQQ